MLDERKIAFIICVNDEEEFAECRYYLERLQVPEEYSTDIISIRGALSAASAYNAGIESSNAKYKVYLHQDTFIKHTGFIADLLKIFDFDEQIGLLGMVGNTDLGTEIGTITIWNTGKVTESSREWNCRFPLESELFKEVQAVDGLLLATQYDLPWREDIFDGWHFYDISQCLEFRKAGYKVVIPWQKEAWCYHDGTKSYKGMDRYYDYYERFILEYAGARGEYSAEERMMDLQTCEQGKEHARKMVVMEEAMEELFAVCGGEGKEKLRELFQNGGLHKWECLGEYEAVVYIDWQEEEQQSTIRFWEKEMSVSQLVSKLRILKRMLKRIEHGIESLETEWILERYSKYAVIEACRRYVMDRDKIYRRFAWIKM